MSSITQKKENAIRWFFRYLKESREELRKVTWPSKQDTTKYSIIVIGLCVILAIFLGGLDIFLSKGMEWLLLKTN